MRGVFTATSDGAELCGIKSCSRAVGAFADTSTLSWTRLWRTCWCIASANPGLPGGLRPYTKQVGDTELILQSIELVVQRLSVADRPLPRIPADSGTKG